MQSHELLREVFQKVSVKQIAADLGLSVSLIYKWAEPPEDDAGSGSTNPLDRIAALQQSTKDPRLTQWLCEQAGGFFIHNPRTHRAHPDFLIPATNEIVQEFADLLAVIASAAADSHISAKEAKTIRARWEELKSVTETFVACCENGNFTPLKSTLGASEKKQSPASTIHQGGDTRKRELNRQLTAPAPDRSLRKSLRSRPGRRSPTPAISARAARG